MGENSGISWTDHTFNPWIGCTKVSPACKNCYAERDMDHRFHKVKWGDGGTRVVTSEKNWWNPNRWNSIAGKSGVRPRVFCASLADVFEDWDGQVQHSSGVPMWLMNEPNGHAKRWGAGHVLDDPNSGLPLKLSDVRKRLFELIDYTPHIDWLLLTKRPENIKKMWPTENDGCNGKLAQAIFGGEGRLVRRRDNVWLGTSVESSQYLHRIDTLKSCGDLAAMLFISAEPVVGPMETLGEHLDGIDWVITGGESGPNARPAEPEWYRSIRDQCSSLNIPFHFKQWGEWIPYEHCGCPPLIESQHGDTYDTHQLPIDLIDHEPIDNWYWPDGLSDTVYRRVGKKTAGRMLDGVEHDAFPRANSQKGIR